MHLKTLTLRGFKSFASATTLNFEPGVTCVVGPNGSGKSNVVDALAWVMGEQGAKSLRGGKMEDVIFAGTAGRPPLGRAEVALTIDNADGALPIEYSEVTISRTLFRNGGSEYAINGQGCRLLDIQDLLSDSGLGREMHVIVGQGQLDAVLRATPEERRGFIEEAAGVLKHRKRKEKALRKLEAMQANLTRLGDLTGEIRRQLGPLGRQAEVARKAAVVQADLRDSRARLLADDLAQLTSTLEQEIADESALRVRREEVEGALAATRARLATLEREAAEAAPALSEASEVWYRLSSLRERLRGTASLAADRVRLLGSAGPERTGGSDPDDLAAQAERVRSAEAELASEVELSRAALEAAVTARQQAEAEATAAEKEVATALRGAADRREGVARLAGQVAARRSRVEATQAELGRLRESLAAAEQRGQDATTQFAVLESQVAGVEEGEEGLDAEHEAAVEALERATERLSALQEQLSAADRERAALESRAETLELSLTRKDGVGALLAADGQPGLVGSVAALLAVDPENEEAIVAALGAVADAVAVESVDAAVDAIRYLRTEDAGRATLLVSGASTARTPPADLPAGAARAVDLVRAPEHVRAAVETLLADVVVVDDLAAARAIVATRPDLVVATRTGDVLSRHRASGGSATAPSALHLQSALDQARSGAAKATADAERARFELTGATAGADAGARGPRADPGPAARVRRGARRRRRAARPPRLGRPRRERRGRAAAAVAGGCVADAGGRHGRAHRACGAAGRGRGRAGRERGRDRRRQRSPRPAGRGGLRRPLRGDRGPADLRTAEERSRAVAGRADSLERAAQTEREARERAASASERRCRQTEVAQAVLDGATYALRARSSRCAGRREQERRRGGGGERDAATGNRRARRDRATGWPRSTPSSIDVAHRDEVARTAAAAAHRALRQRSIDELGTRSRRC